MSASKRAGELFEISDGNRQAVITEQGAGLFRARWDGAELLNTVTEDGFGAYGCHGQLLVPWPGRVADGRYTFEGETYQLHIDDRQHGAAIHGFARWATWQVVAKTAGSITLGCRLLAVPGYPFPLELRQDYAWRGDHLDISFSATNIGARTAPFGYGCHPYLSVGSGTVDDDLLHVPAARYLQTADGLRPTGVLLDVEATGYDFRKPRPVGPAELDVTFAELERGPDGYITVSLTGPDGGLSVECRYSQSVNFVQVYSGDTLPAGQRRGLAMEPYTCAPNAFNNGIGLLALQPGTSVRVHWELAAKPA